MAPSRICKLLVLSWVAVKFSNQSMIGIVEKRDPLRNTGVEDQHLHLANTRNAAIEPKNSVKSNGLRTACIQFETESWKAQFRSRLETLLVACRLAWPASINDNLTRDNQIM